MLGYHNSASQNLKAAHLRRLHTVSLEIGGVHASADPVEIKTILGSCIAACLFDPVTRIGGMNHFLLPGDTEDAGLSTRYGVNAMELLINQMIKLGAHRPTIEAKIFGGGDIFRSNHPCMAIGAKNIRFVLGFLETESIPVVTSRVGGKQGLMVVFLPHTFEVFVKPLTMNRFSITEEKELLYRGRLTQQLANEPSGRITLF
jgi:chemotaxis receptor (MCP) glutamine deamidase CheD